MTSGSSVCCFFKLVLRTLAVVGFICVLMVTLEVQRGGATKTAATSTSSTAESFARDIEHAADPLGKEKLVHPEQDLNYMSKRRVPNGPDPIHNRRAGSSGRPPGQA